MDWLSCAGFGWIGQTNAKVYLSSSPHYSLYPLIFLKICCWTLRTESLFHPYYGCLCMFQNGWVPNVQHSDLGYLVSGYTWTSYATGWEHWGTYCPCWGQNKAGVLSTQRSIIFPKLIALSSASPDHKPFFSRSSAHPNVETYKYLQKPNNKLVQATSKLACGDSATICKANIWIQNC